MSSRSELPKIALIVTGSVAAVKTFLLAEKLVQKGLSPQFIVTDAAWVFLRSGGKYQATAQQLRELEESAASSSANIKKALDESIAVLIAPASADFIRQLAFGDTVLGQRIRSCGRPVMIAPAMNFMMWGHPAVQKNLRAVEDADIKILGPDFGDMACGDHGYGRMSDPAAIAEAVLAVVEGRGHVLLEFGKNAWIKNARLPAVVRKPCRKILLVVQSPGTSVLSYLDHWIKDGYDVQCVVPAEFLHSPDMQKMQRITGRPVVHAHYQLYPKDGMEHIWLPEESDVVIMWPLSPRYAAEMARGAAESFIGCLYLATKRPVLVIPMPDCAEADLQALASHGAVLTDAGNVMQMIAGMEQELPSDFAGKSFLVLSGNPRETVDSFRFYINSARPEEHGQRVAAELEARGAKVVLLTAAGSVQDLLDAAYSLKDKEFDAVLQLASVSQFTCPTPALHKISKRGMEHARLFDVVGSVDLLKSLGEIFGAQKVVGYNNYQEWIEGVVPFLRYKIDSLVRRSAFFKTAHEDTQETNRTSMDTSRVLITTGRTEEFLTTDGTVITNGFTGRQGQEIAKAFVRRGAQVVLVSGPTALPDVEDVRTVHVRSMPQMYAAVMREIEKSVDIYIGVAAIADFSVAQPLSLRLSPGESYKIQMVENPSIVSEVARHPTHRPRIVVSFAAQSPEEILSYATEKFEKSGVDLTIANPIGPGSATTRDPARNEVYFIYKSGGRVLNEKFDEMTKEEVAEKIVAKITSFSS